MPAPYSITYRKDRRTYCARVITGYNEKGNAKRIGKSFTTKTEAREWAIKTSLAIANKPKGSNTTLSNYLIYWLKHHRHNIKQRTYEEYTYDIAKYINPHLGTIELRSLTPKRLQDWQNMLRTTHCAARLSLP